MAAAGGELVDLVLPLRMRHRREASEDAVALLHDGGSTDSAAIWPVQLALVVEADDAAPALQGGLQWESHCSSDTPAQLKAGPAVSVRRTLSSNDSEGELEMHRVPRPRMATVVVASIALSLLSFNAAPVAAQQGGSPREQQSGGLPELEKRVVGVEKNVSELNTTTEEQATDLTDLAARLLALENNVAQLQNQVTSLSTEMTTLKGQVAKLAGDVTDLKTRVASLDGVVSTLQTNLAALEGLANQLQTRLNALNALSSLSSGVKRLLAWVRLPPVTYYLSAWLFELDLTCPVGVPLQAMLGGTSIHIESMVPTLNVDLGQGVTSPTPLDIAAPAGIKVHFTVGMGTPGPYPGIFPVTPFVLCLNVDGLTAMAPDLSEPIVP